MTDDAKPDAKKDMRDEFMALAEAMNNLAAALRESNQLVREMQLTGTENEGGLLQALTDLSQRVAVLSTRLR